MIVIALLFVASAVLAISAVCLFVWSARQRTHEHADRLTLLPLDD